MNGLRKRGMRAVLLIDALAVIAVLIAIRDGSPLIYRAQRACQHGRPFELYKFRTMVPSGGSSVTVWAEPRVTPLGRRLRRTKLASCPSTSCPAGRHELRGPPSEDPSYVALYTDEQRPRSQG